MLPLIQNTTPGLHDGTKISPHELVHDFPATCFNEAFAIGNGRIGAMVYGQVNQETLSLNDDTLWAGHRPAGPDPKAKLALPEIRRLIFEGKIDQAELLTEQTQQVEFVQPYLPAGTLSLEWSDDNASAYERSLSLKDAVVTVKTSSMVRRYFASEPTQQLRVSCRSTNQSVRRVAIRLSAKLEHEVSIEDGLLVLRGRAPEAVLWENVHMATTETHKTVYGDLSRQYAIVIAIHSNTGEITEQDGAVVVSDFEDLDLSIALSTDAHASDSAAYCKQNLSMGSNADDINTHISAHTELYDRTSLELTHNNDQTVVLENFMFNYARYLMISASRSGTMPANLQGIWNEDVMPPWWSNYTVNINLQMNYWMAEACGLSTCHQSLIDYIASLVPSGRLTAQEHFGCRGWVLCHQTDYRRTTTPIGYSKKPGIECSSSWSMWPFGSAWLCLHLYEHYQYSQDSDFLKQRGYPIMIEAAEFLLDWFIPDPTHEDALTTAPSTSPENSYLHPDGYRASVCTASAMDVSIARNLFEKVLLCADILSDYTDSRLTEIRNALTRLPTLKMNSDGTISEFGVDVRGAEDPHRHISQLFSLTPGHDLDHALVPAARATLNDKGLSGTGWALAWKAKCWARLGEGELARQHLSKLLTAVNKNVVAMGNSGGGVYPNLMTACPPFQIDANFGYGAAVLDMLVQTRENRIDLLPALPAAWHTGELTGVRLPGGGVLNLLWNDQGVSGSVRRESSQRLSIYYQQAMIEVHFNTHSDQRFEFPVANVSRKTS